MKTSLVLVQNNQIMLSRQSTPRSSMATPSSSRSCKRTELFENTHIYIYTHHTHTHTHITHHTYHTYISLLLMTSLVFLMPIIIKICFQIKMSTQCTSIAKIPNTNIAIAHIAKHRHKHTHTHIHTLTHTYTHTHTHTHTSLSHTQTHVIVNLWL